MSKNTNSSDSLTSEPKLCFILGILQRSGTHHIYRLLGLHPDCLSTNFLTEYFLMHHSETLKNYIDGVYELWQPKNKIERNIDARNMLWRCLGDSLGRFLKLQITKSKAPQSLTSQTTSEESRSRIMLAKTPSVKGSNNLFDLLPGSYLIILIRDGRAIVESGAKTFGWNYESAMRNWADAAKIILDLKEKCKDSDNKLLVLKYEDLVNDEKNELLKVFDFLGLNAELFDFDKAKSLNVVGSSEAIKQSGHMHWEPITKTKEFNPLKRFSDWDKKKRSRFNWIAGRYMAQLGYDTIEVSSKEPLDIARNKLLDFLWVLRRIWLNITRRVIKRLSPKSTLA